MSKMQHEKPGRRQHITTGLVLIGLGALFFADSRGWLHLQQLRSYWPALIGLVGLGQMVGARDAGQMAKGGFLIFLSVWLYASIENLWGLDFSNSWPLLLIAVGLGKIATGLAGPSHSEQDRE